MKDIIEALMLSLACIFFAALGASVLVGLPAVAVIFILKLFGVL
jgi:hypothetical protein